MPHKVLNGNIHEQPIVVVSGLPRSGTSMMMAMLEAGGMAVLVDRARAADLDNPNGYFEFAPVKKIAIDQAWLASAGGKAVKIVSPLLQRAPATFSYKIIFMHRALPEVLASQQRMLRRRGEEALYDVAKMSELYKKHLLGIKEWLASQPHMEVLDVDYSDTLSNPMDTALRVSALLHRSLNLEAMTDRVDSSLYRQRAQKGG